MRKMRDNRNRHFAFSEDKSILIYKTNAVRESIRSGAAKKVYFLASHRNQLLMDECATRGIPFEIVEDADRFAALALRQPHQGAVAICDLIPTVSLEKMIEGASRKDHPVILLLDGIEDPHNMGAILRSVDAFGIDGVVIKNSGNAKINSTVANVSTGACFYTPICIVPNLSAAIEKLKENGYWIASSDGSATMSYQDLDYDRKLAFVVGSEGFGISKLVLKNSDYVISIPMQGHVNSLNASVAAAILLSYAKSVRH